MKSKFILGLLIATNLVLVALLARGMAERGRLGAATPDDPGAAATPESTSDSGRSSPPVVETSSRQNLTSRRGVSASAAPEAPFTQVYSQDGAQFASHLRAIGCPEETVKDILVAEINRRYARYEQELRPKPADHVPILWSANPSERRLVERREKAAATAREKAVQLRTALGYEVPVAMPVYALTTGEQRFQESRTALTAEQRAVAIRADEDYWAKAQTILDRTKGFWQPEDVAELQRLKAERRAAIASVGGAQ